MTSVKAAAIAGVLAVLAITGLRAGPPQAETGASTSAHAGQAAVGTAAASVRCARVAGTTAVQDAALIRTPAGALHVVPFRLAWEIYNGRRPGTFLSLCGPR